jgi:hypothetical protein
MPLVLQTAVLARACAVQGQSREGFQTVAAIGAQPPVRRAEVILSVVGRNEKIKDHLFTRQEK